MKSAPWLPEEEMSAPKPVVAIPMITSWAIGHRRTMRPLFISYFHTILAIFFGPGIYLTLVNTEFRSSSSFSLLSLSFAFVPLRNLIFMGLHILASVQVPKPGPTLVP